MTMKKHFFLDMKKAAVVQSSWESQSCLERGYMKGASFSIFEFANVHVSTVLESFFI